MTHYISSIWEFNDEQKHPIHDVFRWYGKLPQQLVRRLVSMYSKQNDRVMANFAGSGTVLTESNLAGRNSIGRDMHPISVLINQVKANKYIPNNTNQFMTQLQNKKYSTVPHVAFPDSDKWFYRESLIRMQGILSEINKFSDPRKKAFYQLCLARIIRKCSKIDSRCINHIVVDHHKKYACPLEEFVNSVSSVISMVRDFRTQGTDSSMEIKQGDARDLDIPDDYINLMISHPPYANAVLYYNIYSLVSTLLGHSYDSIRKYDMSSGGFNTYLQNLDTTLQENYRVLKSGSYNALIIGDLRKNGQILTAVPHLIQKSRDIGFVLEDVFIWKLHKKAGMSVVRRGNHIDHNYILIMKKVS